MPPARQDSVRTELPRTHSPHEARVGRGLTRDRQPGPPAATAHGTGRFRPLKRASLRRRPGPVPLAGSGTLATSGSMASVAPGARTPASDGSTASVSDGSRTLATSGSRPPAMDGSPAPAPAGSRPPAMAQPPGSADGSWPPAKAAGLQTAPRETARAARRSAPTRTARRSGTARAARRSALTRTARRSAPTRPARAASLRAAPKSRTGPACGSSGPRNATLPLPRSATLPPGASARAIPSAAHPVASPVPPPRRPPPHRPPPQHPTAARVPCLMPTTLRTRPDRPADALVRNSVGQMSRVPEPRRQLT